MKTDRETLARITLSRHTLARYSKAGTMFNDGNLVRDEIAVLRQIAEDWPERADTIGRLIERWEVLLGH